MVVACSAMPVPDLPAGFRRMYPGSGVRLEEANSDVLLRRLRERSLGVAWVAVGPEDAPGVALHVPAGEAIVAAVAAGDTLGGRGPLDVRDLEGARRLQAAFTALPLRTRDAAW